MKSAAEMLGAIAVEALQTHWDRVLELAKQVPLGIYDGGPIAMLHRDTTKFHESFNARDWAVAFLETVAKHPEIATDEGTMIAWFANAIMRGHDEANTRARALHPLSEWHDDHGDVLWWKVPIDEPPYVGSPLSMDWPGYHTHWTRLQIPQP